MEQAKEKCLANDCSSQFKGFSNYLADSQSIILRICCILFSLPKPFLSFVCQPKIGPISQPPYPPLLLLAEGESSSG